MRVRAAVVLAAVTVALLPWPPVAATTFVDEDAGARAISRNELRDAVLQLSSDWFEGRLTGSSGNRSAVRYLAAAVERAGLRPAGTGVLQRFTLLAQRLDGTPRLEATPDANGAPRRFKAGRDFDPVFPTGSGRVSGVLAFAGYGVVADAAGHDDYSAVDLAGRPVLIVDADPRGSDERALAWHDALPLAARVRAAAARGATAVIVAAPESISRLAPPLSWARRDESPPRHLALQEDKAPVPVVRLSATAAIRLLGEQDTDTPGIRLRNLADQTPSARALPPVEIRLEMHVADVAVHTENVVAWVAGTAPALASDMVLVGAHLDHEGRNSKGQIMNGADDNASGTAAVLEIARAFAQRAAAGDGTARPVAFAFWNAEERGMLGSRYYASHVQPAGHQVIACLNLDMVGRREHIPKGPSDPRFGGLPPVAENTSAATLHGIGYSYSEDLAARARAAATAEGLDLRLDYDAHAIDLLHRSDHWSFLRLGIPALFLTTGLHPDYHTPDDDGNRIELGKLERVARMAYRLARAIADAEKAPRLTPPTSRN